MGYARYIEYIHVRFSEKYTRYIEHILRADGDPSARIFVIKPETEMILTGEAI